MKSRPDQIIAKIDIRQVTAAETIDIRHRVMWPNRPRADVVLEGDPEALHFGAFVDDLLVGVGSFFKKNDKYRLRKLAVEERFQGVGIASKLLNTAVEDLRASGGAEIWCDARVSALDFYRQNGFTVDDNVFQKQGLDYVLAKRTL